MTTRFTPKPQKTYATEANAVKAAETAAGTENLRYMVVCTPEGRFYPIFIGQQALQMVFCGFTVVG